jgi:FdhD protein
LKRYRTPYKADQKTEGGLMPWRITRLDGGQEQLVEGAVVVEEPLEVRINGQAVAVLMRTPGMEKELAAGFCLGEGLVADLWDIGLIRHCGRAVPDEVAEGDALDHSRNRVDVTLLPGVAGTWEGREVAQLIRSGCGRAEAGTLIRNLAPVDGDVRLRAEAIPPLLGQITRQQAAYRAAGGIHAAAIFDEHGRVIVVCEDIGRHNAVDKATGYCLLRGIPLRDKVLVCTGRASYDMVAKGVRLGLPVLASISSPTSLAVEMADALNCTLLGYLRGKSLNIYTHGWRIVPGEDDPIASIE